VREKQKECVNKEASSAKTKKCSNVGQREFGWKYKR